MNQPLARITLPLLLGFPLAALADVPKVAVDIPPVHSLVSQMMGELGEPALFMQQGGRRRMAIRCALQKRKHWMMLRW